MDDPYPTRLQVAVRVEYMEHLSSTDPRGLLNEAAFDDLRKIFAPAGLELSFSSGNVEGIEFATALEDRVIKSHFLELRSGHEGITDETIIVFVASRWKGHEHIAGELWNKRDRNEIAIFAESILDDETIENEQRAFTRVLAHELAHAFGLRHMDWQGNAYRSNSTIEGYSDLDSVLMCLSRNSVAYLRTAPLTFVRPGDQAVPYSIVTYGHSARFQADPRDTVIAVSETVTAEEIARWRDGYIPSGADLAHLAQAATNQSELVGTLTALESSFEPHSTIKLKLRLRNHSSDNWYAPRAEDIMQPDVMASGSDQKALLLVPAVSEIKPLRIIEPGMSTDYDIEVSELPGFRSGGSTSREPGIYSIRIAIPVSRHEEAMTGNLVAAATTIELSSSALSALSVKIDDELERKFGADAARGFQYLLRFGFSKNELKMKEYLEELLGSGDDGPQRANICRALLNEAEHPLDGSKPSAVPQALRNTCVTPDVENARAEETSAVVGFEPGSSVVPRDQLDTLRAVAARVRREPSARVVLVGRADSPGTSAGNCLIGMYRATAVERSLQLLEIPPKRITVVSRGELDAPGGPSQEPSADERRVDLRIYDPADESATAIVPTGCWSLPSQVPASS